jgi:hypothetical protein
MIRKKFEVSAAYSRFGEGKRKPKQFQMSKWMGFSSFKFYPILDTLGILAHFKQSFFFEGLV